MQHPHIEIRNLTFAYPGASPLFRDVNLAVGAGGFVILRGPSGGGKSTFLRLLCRLEEAGEGEIFIHGQNLRDFDPPQLRREVSYIQQTPTVVPGSVRENLLLPFSFKANRDLPLPSDAELSERLRAFLLDVPLAADAGTLSVGQKQRLCLVRAMLLRPSVLLMDEPTSALDPESAALVLKDAEKINREQGATILMITHAGYQPDVPGAKTLEIRHGRAELI